MVNVWIVDKLSSAKNDHYIFFLLLKIEDLGPQILAYS